MRMPLLVLVALLHLIGIATLGHAEVLIRWTQPDVPTPQTLGVPVLVVPAGNPATVRHALTQGYRVYVELDAAALATFIPPTQGLAGVVVKGNATPTQLAALGRRLAPLNARVLTLDERGKWPHIRSNWVTKNNDVLPVAGRSAQPWIESNAALIRIIAAEHADVPPFLTYQWTPVTVSDADEGPALEDYLVAVAEAGSFGANLVLPLHDRFQRRLLLGQPGGAPGLERAAALHRVLRGEPSQPVQAYRQYRRSHEHADGAVRGDEPAGPAQPAVRGDLALAARRSSGSLR